VADRARSMSLHGLSRQAWSRYADGGSWSYDIAAPGFKYNLTDLAAAIGLAQLSRAELMRERRAEIARRYTDAFADDDALQCPADPSGIGHSWHLYLLRINPDQLSVDRNTFITELNARGIGTSVHFIPLHLHSYYVKEYGYAPDDLPIATREFERVISLPIYSAMTDADVGRVISAVRDVATRHRAP